jgi:hypothetical protein
MNKYPNIPVRIPSNIDFVELFDGIKGNKTKIQFLKDGMIYILSLLIVDNYTLFSDGEYKRLNNKILSDIIGDKRPEQIMRILKENGIIEVKSYSKGRFSKGYRLTESYNTGQFKKVKLSDRIKNKIINYRNKHKTKEKDLTDELFYILEQFDKNKLELDNLNLDRFIKTLGIELFHKTITLNEKQRGFTLKSTFNYIGKIKSLIEDINNRKYYRSFSESNHRFNSNITSLPKILRPFLRINGSNIGEIDISSSQPYILSTILNPQFSSTQTEGYNLITIYEDLFKTFLSLKSVVTSHQRGNTVYELGVYMTEKEHQGLMKFSQFDFTQDFYQHILDEGYRLFPNFMGSKKRFNKGRGYIKKYVMYFLFVRDEVVREDTDVVELLKLIYPDLCNFVERFNLDYGVRDFSILLQRTESYLILTNVCKKIYLEYPEIPFFTIHDSIITIDTYLDKVKEIITDTILEITGKPVKVKSLKYEQPTEIRPDDFNEIWDGIKVPTFERYNKMKKFFLTDNINRGFSILPSTEQVHWKGIMDSEINKVVKG